MSHAPIGVFDSGVGGLSILSSIRRLLPQESLLYFADSLHAPYGPKGELFIQQRSLLLMDLLENLQAKAVVVACNTATAAAIALLRQRFSIPIIGVEPAVKPAAALSKTGVIGVLATSGTIASDKFINLQNRFVDRVQILTRAGTGLVELIENPNGSEDDLLQLLQHYLAPMLNNRMDTLVLGCTHYSLIKTQIALIVGPEVNIVDAGSAVAKEVQRRLQEKGLNKLTQEPGEQAFYSNGDLAVQQQLLEKYWKTPISINSFTDLS